MHNFVDITARIGHPVLGALLPAAIFGLSVLLTMMLIRHFIRSNIKDKSESGTK